LSIEQINAEIENFAKPRYVKFLVDLTKDIPDPQPLLKRGEHIIFSRGNISCITGQAKSRKTFCISLLCADFLNENKSGNILIVDTEQSASYVWMNTRRILRILNWNVRQNNPRLSVLPLRAFSIQERITLFKEAIMDLKPDIVFLDGVRDLVLDINSNAETSEMIALLLQLSAQCENTICCTLHENPSNDKVRGTLGTEMQNKCETVISVAKVDEQLSTCEPKLTRGKSFDKFSFYINDEGLPQYCEMPTQENKMINKLTKFDERYSLCQKILNNDKELSYTELTNQIMRIEEKSERTAQQRIKESENFGIIKKNSNGNYVLIYHPQSSLSPLSPSSPLPF